MKEIYIDALLPAGTGTGEKDDPCSPDMMTYDPDGMRIWIKDHGKDTFGKHDWNEQDQTDKLIFRDYPA